MNLAKKGGGQRKFMKDLDLHFQKKYGGSGGRIHKIKNYHYYVIYLLGKEKHTAVVNHFSEN